MMRSACVLLALTASAVAQSLPELKKATVHVVVDDVNRLEALRMLKRRAPIAQLRQLKIDQPYRLLVSGVAISKDGEIVVPALHPTANLKVEVTFYDGEKSLATVIGTDAHTNLALVKVPKTLKHYLVLRDGPLEAGTAVTVIGHRAQQVAVSTSFATQIKRIHEPVNVFNLYTGQFTANPLAVAVSINEHAPRNGSVCVTGDGKLAGVVVGSMPPKLQRKNGRLYVLRGVYMQPAERVARVVRELREAGRVRRAFFGLRAVPVAADVRAHFPSLPNCASAVTSVQRDQPADKAGLRVHDVILSINGKSCLNACLLAESLSDCTPNEPAKLEILRAGEKKTITVTPTPAR